MTRNHNYATPNEGTIDWHVPLNRNFERIDTDAEIRDTESNIEDYEPKPGAKFLATDSGVVFIGDGTDWTSLGSVVDPERVADVGHDHNRTYAATDHEHPLADIDVSGGSAGQIVEVDGEGDSLTLGADDTGSDSGGSYPSSPTLDHLDFDDEVVEIGQGATANRGTEAGGSLRHCIAIGHNAESTSLGTIAIGSDFNGNTRATADDAMAIGPDNAQATAEDAHALGEGARAYGESSLAVGKGSLAEEVGSAAFGSKSNSGASSRARAPYATAIGGALAANNADDSVVIGHGAVNRTANCVAIGAETKIENTSNLARIGDGSATVGPDQLVFTATQDTIADADLNNGEMTVEIDETNGAFRLRAKDSGGTIRTETVPYSQTQQVTLSSGSATINTSQSDFVNVTGLRTDSGQDANVAVSQSLDSNGDQVIDVVETGTSVNPTVTVRYTVG